MEPRLYGRQTLHGIPVRIPRGMLADKLHHSQNTGSACGAASAERDAAQPLAAVGELVGKRSWPASSLARS